MKIVAIILVFLAFCSCSTSNSALVGVWRGEDAFVDSTISNKKWLFTRYANGKYSVDFKYHLKGKYTELTEKGKWKSKSNIYYEKTKTMKKYDTFIFEIKNDSTIKYSAVRLDKTTDIASRTNYSFIDHKITK